MNKWKQVNVMIGVKGEKKRTQNGQLPGKAREISTK